jgi:ribonuclease HII
VDTRTISRNNCYMKALRELKKRKIKYIVGIDEAGRGALAGPVSVGAVAVPVTFDTGFFKGVRDSKQLSALARETWFTKLDEHTGLTYTVCFSGPSVIDRQGIVGAVRRALARTLSLLACKPKETLIFLDGGLYAPEEYIYQETIIRGDESEPLISLASIVAKVKRDKYMTALSRSDSAYGFERHKGYGTKEHFRMIEKHGVSSVHRNSFLTRLT